METPGEAVETPAGGKRTSRRKSNAERTSLAAKKNTSVSMRRFSRRYSLSVNPRNILDHKTRLTLEWHNFGYRVDLPKTLGDRLKRKLAEERVLLIGLEGIVKPGELMGIMGPSGCGKTTFMKLLAGRLNGGRMDGEILVNGQPRTHNWRYAVSYVEQDTSYLDPRMTVQEMIEYVGGLIIPKKYGKEEKQERMKHVLQMLGIGHLSESLIGGNGVKGISGGERKRLAIAIELLQEPNIIFLDEPTSGLDSKMAARESTLYSCQADSD